MKFSKQYGVIVVGGGHAGAESALAASRMGIETLLLTHNIDTLGQMSCNPSIGGIGKGHLVKEIDALGGIMGKAADAAGIHVRILNASKGPAVRATRAQADRPLYKKSVRMALENEPHLSIFQQAVEDLLLEGDKVVGVVTQMGLVFYAETVVLTAGTFLGGKIHIGQSQYQGGRAGDPPSISLAARLREMPFNVGRLKTGTPPRIDGRSIDFSKLEQQHGDTPLPYFSLEAPPLYRPRQVPCYIAKTNPRTHEIIRSGLSRSPLFTGAIEGVGPRYCPSIEDKVVRFSDKETHQIFIEPEGLETVEIYPNGISTSLPFDVQLELVRSMVGLEKAHITRPGYAIEYDYFDPQGLYHWLETKSIRNLFFAGQINGTTGYEEAAAQGLLAGMNAALRVKGEAPWYPKRHEAYIGVLVDDLITQGTHEPYRMFTSRAEYRLMLREDNADIRLTEKGYQLGVVNQTRYDAFLAKQERITKGQAALKTILIRKDSEAAEALGIEQEVWAHEALKRPEITSLQLCEKLDLPFSEDKIVWEQIEIDIKYEGYIRRQQDEVERLSRFESLRIPDNFDYAISGLSNELRAKLSRIKPTTIGEASRIPGMTPAAVSLLLVVLRKG